MRNIILLMLIIVFAGCKNNQQEAVEVPGEMVFEHGSLDQAIKTAKKQNKKIFIDFYTQWCGPCRNMAKNVFTLPEVGGFYNKYFVNLKIDAELPEYKAIVERFKIHSYPTYIYLDPVKDEVILHSGSSMSGEDFIKIAKQALNPDPTGANLTKRYNAGERSAQFLKEYTEYLYLNKRKKEGLKIYKEYMALDETNLKDPFAWKYFNKYIRGYRNDLFKYCIDHYGELKAIHGEVVMEKVTRTYMNPIERSLHAIMYRPGGDEKEYLKIRDEISTYDFETKDFALKYTKAMYLLVQNKYDASHELIVSILNSEKYSFDFLEYKIRGFCGYYYTARHNTKYAKHALVYMRWLAYNNPNREKNRYTHKYAVLLEEVLLNSNIEKSKYYTKEPLFGVKKYTDRPKDLKPKPMKK